MRRPVAARRVAKSFSGFAAAGHRPGDMVVLLGGMGRANVYAEALRAEGLPCVVAEAVPSSTALPRSRLMVRLGAGHREPEVDSLALFEVLSSELFALSADDLLELSTGMRRGVGRVFLAGGAFDQGFRHIERKVASGRAVSPALAAVRKPDAPSVRAGGKRGACRPSCRASCADSGWLCAP